MNKFEAFLKEKYKGRKYGHRDAYEYHLVGVAELAREKAREANLDPELAYAIGLSHDYLEDFKVDNAPFLFHDIAKEIDWVQELTEEAHTIFFTALLEISNSSNKSYYHYIKSITNSYALLVKEADLEFNLLQDNAPKLRKYPLYKFALDYIKMKRIVKA